MEQPENGGVIILAIHKKTVFSCLRMATLLAVVAGILLLNLRTMGQPDRVHSPTMHSYLDDMVAKLSLQEKIRLLGGAPGMSIRAEPRIGMPALRMSDGPMGVKSWGPSIAYAAGINLAATWDIALSQQMGVVLGEDARARGVSFLLGPGVDIYRAPMNGRNFEYFGEDPYLASQIAVGYIRGVQSQGVVATIKHFAANNSEYDRHRENSIIDERTLREIYLPAFEAAVKEGRVGAVMDSYNLINGQHATQNSYLNNQILRKEWGFRGILMSDWGATYDGIAAANAGLDLEMGNADFMTTKILLPAIASGTVSEAAIDQKVRRILRTVMQFGLFHPDQTDNRIPLYNQAGIEIALKSAEEGMVLLKNHGGLLPLNRDKIHSIAVLGPDAYPAVPGGGGSSQVTAIDPVSFMTGISDSLYRFGTTVYWNSGIRSADSIFDDTHWCADPACKKSGLLRTDYIAATNAKISSGEDAQLDSWHNPGGDDWRPGYRRVEWSGYYIPKKSGEFRIIATAVGEDSYRVLADGKVVLEVPSHQNGQAPKSASIALTSGKPVHVRFIYWPMTEQRTVGLGFIEENKLIDPKAIQLAKMADVTVVSVGFGPSTEGEGLDRTYHLPFGQEKLIESVAAANPRTIVVLTSGGSVATQDWIGEIPALVQTWYAGQQGGIALAKILFGDVNPSGKLPISWEHRLDDNPAVKNYYEQPGSRNVKYAEGILIGYRYYDQSKIKPLFPFGFGLSYTSFAFSKLTVTPPTIFPSEPLTVSFGVRNTGTRAGSEIAEVYVGDPSATVLRPEKELKGFARVLLQPGESHRVAIKLNRRSFAYWDTGTHRWKVDPGKFVVYVGDSSENVPLRKAFTIQ